MKKNSKTQIGLGLAALGRPEYINIRTDNSIDKSEEAFKKNTFSVFLGTKWGYTYVANWELGFEGKHEVKEHSLKKLVEQWQVSKQMLPKLKYYQVHSATFESGILENETVLNQLLLTILKIYYVIMQTHLLD